MTDNEAGKPSVYRTAANRVAQKLKATSVIETSLLVCGLLVFNHFIVPDNFGFLKSPIHPFWGIVILISIKYSFSENMLCAFLLAVSHITLFLIDKEGNYHFSSIGTLNDVKVPMLYMVVAGIISDNRDRMMQKIRDNEARIDSLTSEIEKGTRRNDAYGVAINQLKARIAAQSTGMRSLFDSLLKTKKMTVDEIRQNLLEVVSAHTNASAIHYYELKDGKLQRVCSYVTDNTEESDRDIGNDIILNESYRNRKLTYLTNMQSQVRLDSFTSGSIAAGPVVDSAGRLLGMAAIEKMPFIDYVPSTFKLLDTILSWWGNALGERYDIDEMRSRIIFDELTGAYTYSYFLNRFAQEFVRSQQYTMPLSLTLIKISDCDSISHEKLMPLRLTVNRIINSKITELDILATYWRDEHLAVLQPFTTGESAGVTMKHVVEELDTYDIQPYRDSYAPLKLEYAIVDYRVGMLNHIEMIMEVEERLDGYPQDAGGNAE